MDEGDGLENRYMGNCIVGSNPTPSASFRHKIGPQTKIWGPLLFHRLVKCARDVHETFTAIPFDASASAHYL